MMDTPNIPYDRAMFHNPGVLKELKPPSPSFPPPHSQSEVIRPLLPTHQREGLDHRIHADTGQKMTQADLLVSSERLAAALQAQGVGPGDVIGVCSENSLEYCIPVLAALYVGATCAPLSAGYTSRELMHTMSLSRPRLIFCSEGAEPLVREAADRVAGLAEEVVVMGRERQFLRHLTLEMFVSDYVSEQGRPQHFQLHRVEHPKDHVAFIFCSSGTTGLPKGVMITHHNVLSLLANQRYAVESDNLPLVEGYALGFMPMYHAYGLMILLYMLEFEATMVVMPHFNPETFLRTIQEYKISWCTLVPPILSFLTKHPVVLQYMCLSITWCAMVPPILAFLAKHPMVLQYDLRSLTRVGIGAAPVSGELLRQFKNRFPHIEFIRQGYGMTELTLSALGNNANNHDKLESVGTVVPGVEAKVIDESGRSLGAGKSGELCFRGCIVMKGYVNNPSATSQIIDHEGWLHSGDVGYYDEEGSFYIVDRLKDLIKYKGFQVPPAELEAILMSHPGVMDAAVIGVPDEGAGELPKAFVVKKDANVTAQQLVDYVNGQVSSAKKLRGGVQFVEAIPKNPSGKILRKELRGVVSPKSKL
uniref:Uncharacterized protein n=1 Tax=Timema monikensis TaxID=170555 RepID=A0A7R9E5N3_9NEOP|nr:unnamed protein product [Timema monikensis]